MITYLQQMIQVQRKESDGMVRADGPKSVRVQNKAQMNFKDLGD